MRKFCACAKLREGWPIAFVGEVASPLIYKNHLGIKSYLYCRSARIYFPHSHDTTQPRKYSHTLNLRPSIARQKIYWVLNFTAGVFTPDLTVNLLFSRKLFLVDSASVVTKFFQGIDWGLQTEPNQRKQSSVFATARPVYE